MNSRPDSDQLLHILDEHQIVPTKKGQAASMGTRCHSGMFLAFVYVSTLADELFRNRRLEDIKMTKAQNENWSLTRQLVLRISPYVFTL